MGYYKVIRNVGGELRSSTPCIGGSLTYHRKKFTRMIPGSLGIFIFKDEWQAKQFAKTHSRINGGNMQVYSCAIVGEPVRAWRVQSIEYTISSFVKMFKKAKTRLLRVKSLLSKEHDRRVSRVRVAPAGAYTVQAVRLKRQVANFGGWRYF